MANTLTEADRKGPGQYCWGISDTDAPSIAGMKVTSAELKYEAEVFSQAQDGEGHTDCVVVTKPVNRMINGTFTGYVTSDVGGSLAPFPWGGRYYLVKSVSVPKKKGEFWEVSVEAQSFFKVTG